MKKIYTLSMIVLLFALCTQLLNAQTTQPGFKQIPLESASDPEKAGFIVLFDLKSPDLVIREEIVNNNSLGTERYTRVK
jgi:hypothetical protein